MDPMLIALVVGIVFGVFVGSRMATRSENEEPIHGGSTAKVLHRLACTAFAGSLPSALTTLLLAHSFLNAIVMAFSFVGVSFLLLILFALVENAPRNRALADDRGWTAEKAQTSGL
ncbi:MAG: hypothetical protein IH587_11330 [Anaerolineae bacterium]|nr:hypothetical protein [Anaerolineae bacterium]